MKKTAFLTLNILTFIFCALSSYTVTADYNKDVFEKIAIKDSDLPAGFVYGKIPNFAKNVIQNNPWNMDKNAISKLTKNIYPNADSATVKDIYMSIVTRKDQPYGDDLVCYMILFKDDGAAKKEIKKIEDFKNNNNDRVILFSKENLAVMLHVDDADDFAYIEKLAKNIENRLQ